MELGLFCKITIRSTSQQISRLSWNPNVHYLIHNIRLSSETAIIADEHLNRYIKTARHIDVPKNLPNYDGDGSYITVFSFLITSLNTDYSNYMESKVVQTIPRALRQTACDH
jgi:hypothetical protein